MTNTDIYGSFYLSGCEFAISVNFVQEVVNPPQSYIAVPLSASYTKGLFNLRGTIIPVIDLRPVLKLDAIEDNREKKIAIINYGDKCIGLLFDGTSEIFRSQVEEKNDFVPSGNPAADVISGVFKKDHGKRLVQILDVDVLFALQGIPKIEGKSVKDQRSKKGQRRQCISFRVGPSLCALGIDAIREIIKADHLDETTLAHKHCIGIYDLRGTTVPILDFASILEYREADNSAQATSGDRRILVIRLGDELFGFLVDSVDSIISYFDEELVSFPVLNNKRDKMFKGCITRPDGGDILLFEHEHVFSSSEISEITRGHSNLYKITTTKDQKKQTGNRHTYITFALNSTFAVGIEQIQEIIDYPKEFMRPPGMPAHIRGVMNLRGNMVTILDAASMYNLKRDTAVEGKVLIFNKNKNHYGLVVDNVESILTFTDEEKVKLPEIIYKTANNKMTEDVIEAVEVKSQTGTKSVLILNLDSLAKRA